MATQLRFSDSRPGVWKAPRPNLVPEFVYANGLGNPHSEGRAITCTEPPRRSDRMPQRYGNGTPTLESAHTDMYGIHRPKKTAHEKASTSEGPVNLPVNFQETYYTPSTAALDFLTHRSDTRLQAQPTRYYR